MSARRVDAWEAAYLDLVESHETAILNYVLRLVGDIDVAEDLTQDTFVKAYQARHLMELGDESRDRRRAWLYRIAHNTAADHLRRRGRIRWLPLGRTLTSPSAEPETRAVASESVEGALCRLSEEQREVLLLFLQAGFSAPEVAQVLGVSAQAARKRLQRAREAFETAYRDSHPAGEVRLGGPAAT